MSPQSPQAQTWKLGWDHDEVIRVTGRVLAAAAGLPRALQEASSIGWGGQRLLELPLHVPQRLGVRGKATESQPRPGQDRAAGAQKALCSPCRTILLLLLTF